MSLITSHRGTAAVLAGSLALAGCGVVNAVKNISHTVAGNRATIDSFTATLKSGEAAPFAATYAGAGGALATVVYAVRPPKELLFKAVSIKGSQGLSGTEVVVNGSGEYLCNPPGSGRPQWKCQKEGKAIAVVQNRIFELYNPSHWVAVLKAFALAAGFAGDKVSTSSMTVNGFSMSCVDFRAAGYPRASTICATAQGILGYVKIDGGPASFQIKSYTTAPSASLFRLPPGARITKAGQ
jgi:hypothetical protein